MSNQTSKTEQDVSNFSLMGLFRLEVETQTAALSQHLIALEQSDNRAHQDHLEALMRAAHSTKGAARIVQVEEAVKVSHALEDCFIAAQQSLLTLTAEHIDVLLMGVDLLSKIGDLEEETLAEQLISYQADVDDVVVAIEEMVSAAEKTNQSQTAPEKPTETDSAKETVLEDIESQAIASAVEPENAEPKDIESENAKPKNAADESNRMIRISASNLSRLMGLAGELLVESNWLQPFADAMLETKRQQQFALSSLEQHSLEWHLEGGPEEDSKKRAEGLEATAAAMQACCAKLSDRLEDVEQFSRRFGQLCDRLHREVIAGHMCAFEEGTQGYARLVRDTAKQQGKQAVLEIKGLSTQIDRDILSKLDAPITHLLTNAVAHGIETPDVRLAKGKPATAKIQLAARHRSGMLIIDIEDDGAGIDFAHLRQKIAANGMVPESVVKQLSEAELIEFLFLPGFSTASRVDQISGRGYGLDIARTMAQSVGGSLQAFSPVKRVNASLYPTDADKIQAGGTRFRFCLPLTLSVVRSLLFEAAGEAYAVSLSRTARVLKLEKEQISYSENRPYFRWGEESISLISVHQILELSSSAANAEKTQEALSVVVLGEANQRYGMCVDRLLGEKDLVVRPLDARLGKVPNISAAALSEAGTPILILDVADVLRSAEKVAAGETRFQSAEVISHEIEDGKADNLQHQTASAQKKILVVDDSMTVRAMEKNLLQNRGYAVDIAVDGAEGWNAVRMADYDLVITDVDMPRMSGIELIRKMRDYEATKKLPVIVVSYKDREADQLAGLDAGANYYLTKSSFHDDGLTTAVVDLIGS